MDGFGPVLLGMPSSPAKGPSAAIRDYVIVMELEAAREKDRGREWDIGNPTKNLASQSTNSELLSLPALYYRQVLNDSACHHRRITHHECVQVAVKLNHIGLSGQANDMR